MYWLWKWLESYNNCIFSTWKYKLVFNLLFWIPNSFCTCHDYGWGGTPFLASPDGPSLIFYHSDFWTTFLPWNFSLCWNIFYLSGLLRNLCLPWKTVCPESTVLNIYIFYHSEFWTTCACTEKQSLPRNFSLHWNIFYLSGFLSNLCLPWKQSLLWIHCIEYIFFIIQNFEQPALVLKNRICPEIFHCIEIFLTFRIFEQLELVLKTEFALKFSSRRGRLHPRLVRHCEAACLGSSHYGYV